MTDKPIEVEAVPESQALVVQSPQAQAVSLFRTSEPAQIIERASEVASRLKNVVQKQGLISNISGKEYPKCEAWTLLGTLLGVFPVLSWTKQLSNGWEARVEAKMLDGSIVGAAEAQCLSTEKNWRNRDDFALRSMAQTRATAKALRMPLGFVMTLAGYEATPAEEMVTDHPRKAQDESEGYSRSPRAATPHTKPPAPKPATSSPIYATDKTRDWMIKELNAADERSEDRRTCTEFFDKAGVLLSTEAIEDLPLSWVPINKVEMQRLKAAIMDFASGGQAHMPYEQHPVRPQEEAPHKPIEVPRDPNPDPNSPDAPWRSFPMPFGKQAGVQLAKLDKNYLFGLWANFKAEKTWTGEDGVERETKPAKYALDLKLREMLDEAGKHYQFTMKEESA